MILQSLFKLCFFLILFVAETGIESEGAGWGLVGCQNFWTPSVSPATSPDHEPNALCLSLPSAKVKCSFLVTQRIRVQNSITTFEVEALKRSACCTMSAHLPKHKKGQRFAGDTFPTLRFPFLWRSQIILMLLSGSHSDERPEKLEKCSWFTSRGTVIGHHGSRQLQCKSFEMHHWLLAPTLLHIAQLMSCIILRLFLLPQLWKHHFWGT